MNLRPLGYEGVLGRNVIRRDLTNANSDKDLRESQLVRFGLVWAWNTDKKRTTRT